MRRSPQDPGRSPRASAAAAAVAEARDPDPAFELVRRIEWPGNHIYQTSFSPDGGLYLGGGDMGTVRIWEVSSGNQILELPVPVAWFAPDGKSVVGHKGDKVLRVFAIDTGEEARNWEAPSACGSTIAFSPDGKRLVAGHQDNTLRIWDLATGQELRKLEGHEDVPSAVFSPDGKQVLSAAADKTVRLWDAETGKLLRTFDDFKNVQAIPGHGMIVQAVFLPGGKEIAAWTWSQDHELKVLEADTGKPIRSVFLGEDHHKDVAISPDGKWILTAHDGRLVKIRGMDGKIVAETEMPEIFVPRAVGFSPDGRYAVAGSLRGWVDLWKLRK